MMPKAFNQSCSASN